MSLSISHCRARGLRAVGVQQALERRVLLHHLRQLLLPRARRVDSARRLLQQPQRQRELLAAQRQQALGVEVQQVQVPQAPLELRAAQRVRAVAARQDHLGQPSAVVQQRGARGGQRLGQARRRAGQLRHRVEELQRAVQFLQGHLGPQPRRAADRRTRVGHDGRQLGQARHGEEAALGLWREVAHQHVVDRGDGRQRQARRLGARVVALELVHLEQELAVEQARVGGGGGREVASEQGFDGRQSLAGQPFALRP